MTNDPVVVTVELKKDRHQAFRAFSKRIADWWPLETHSIGPFLGEPAPETVILEEREGGRIYEISPAGVERLWGEIITWKDGERLEFTWHPGKSETLKTLVKVTFTATDTNGTVVTLVHSGWQVLGAEAEEIRKNYVSGWASNLTQHFMPFAETAAGP